MIKMNEVQTYDFKCFYDNHSCVNFLFAGPSADSNAIRQSTFDPRGSVD